MNRGLSKLERKSTHSVKSLIGEFLLLQSQHFKGETTINQLRIGHYIGLMSQYEGKPTSNKQIADALGIPRSTVSRVVADCVEKGWVVERPHPEDGRKRQLLIEPTHPEGDNFEKDFRHLFNDMIRLFQSGRIVLVDPSKEGF